VSYAKEKIKASHTSCEALVLSFLLYARGVSSFARLILGTYLLKVPRRFEKSWWLVLRSKTKAKEKIKGSHRILYPMRRKR